MYVTYTFSQRLSPTPLWIQKFDFKLGCLGHEFQNYPIIATFLKFDVKSMLFFFNLSIIFDFSEFCFQKCVFSKTPYYGDEINQKNGIPLRLSFSLFFLPDCR